VLHDPGELLQARNELAHPGRCGALGERIRGRARAHSRQLLRLGQLLEDRGQRLERLLEPVEAVLGHATARLGDVSLGGALLRGAGLLAVGLGGGVSELLADVLE
jgi:hypothetical protein